MAGRTPLRIGQRGKISRTYVGEGVWEAKCRYRDTDGVTRQVRRRSPADEHDRYGKLAEGLLIEALADRRPPTDEIGPDTAVMTLVEAHLNRLAEDGRSPSTQDTYKLVAGKLRAKLGGVRIAEANPARIDAVLRAMTNTHGPGMARQSKTILSGALQLAVMANVLAGNPVRDVAAIRSQRPPKGAPVLSVEQLRDLLVGLRSSDYCREYDLADPFTLLVATGLRRGELLGLRWSDYDEMAGTLAICGKVVRVTGKGLVRGDETKTAAGRRTIALPLFAIDMLAARRSLPYFGEHPTIMFPSTAGTWRDPNNFGRDWRRVRSELGAPNVTTHSFRKSVATLIDDRGFSARISADQLGHARPSMTQDRYMARGKVHIAVAEALDDAISGAKPLHGPAGTTKNGL
ncbi:site-specific integrase [Mycolicibacterium moriokaense]|nr:site-specific integrase [Mycolicibacterium moriokaense]